MTDMAEEMAALLRYANYAKVGDALGVGRAAVQKWAKGKNVGPYQVEQVRRLMAESVGTALQTKEAPSAEAEGAVPEWAMRLLAGVISLENDAGLTEDERDRARAQAMTWLELSGSRSRRRGSDGGATGGASA